MYDAGCFGEGALGLTRQQGAEAVAGGLALAQVDVGGQKRIMQDIAPDAHFLVTGIPATNDGKTFVTALPGYTVAVNAQAKNPEAAKAFLAELASPSRRSSTPTRSPPCRSFPTTSSSRRLISKASRLSWLPATTPSWPTLAPAPCSSN